MGGYQYEITDNEMIIRKPMNLGVRDPALPISQVVCVIPKEAFIEAHNRWIKKEDDERIPETQEQ